MHRCGFLTLAMLHLAAASTGLAQEPAPAKPPTLSKDGDQAPEARKDEKPQVQGSEQSVDDDADGRGSSADTPRRARAQKRRVARRRARVRVRATVDVLDPRDDIRDIISQLRSRERGGGAATQRAAGHRPGARPAPESRRLKAGKRPKGSAREASRESRQRQFRQHRQRQRRQAREVRSREHRTIEATRPRRPLPGSSQ